MMNNIPTEILILIFKYLHLKQKLECILVCRIWAQVLHQGYLFETVHFSFSKKSGTFCQHRNSLKKKKLFPMMKCKRLVFDEGAHSGTNIATLATSFPNLTLFYSVSSIHSTPKSISKSHGSTIFTSDPFIGWRSNLKTFIYASDAEHSHLYFLHTGIFGCLTTLKMCPFSASMIPSLKNTPALNKLSISIHTITLDHLEDLHVIVPGLTSLTLKGNPQPNDSNEMLPKIIPAEKIKDLQLIRINGAQSSDISNTFSSFIKAKYTRLNEFSCGITDEYKWGTISTIFSDANFADFITTTGTGLNKCMISLRGASTGTVKLIEEHMAQLEVLGIDIFGCKDIFERVESGRESQDLTTVTPSRQLLDLKSTEFEKFTYLKELMLDFSSMPYESTEHYQTTFKKIVDKLPHTVQTLGLKSVRITVGQEQETIQVCTRIRNLKLYHVKVSGEMISISIAQNFPGLKSLVLYSCTLDNTTSFKLPDHHLEYFEYVPDIQHFTVTSHDRGLMTHLEITVAGQTLYYGVPQNRGGESAFAYNNIMYAQDRPIQRVLKAFHDIDKSTVFFHFEFANVQTVFFSNFMLLV